MSAQVMRLDAVTGRHLGIRHMGVQVVERAVLAGGDLPAEHVAVLVELHHGGADDLMEDRLHAGLARDDLRARHGAGRHDLVGLDVRIGRGNALELALGVREHGPATTAVGHQIRDRL